LNEEDLKTIREVATWVNEPLAGGLLETPQEYWWNLLRLGWTPIAGPTYYIAAEFLDPFIPDFKRFFGNIYDWVVSKWQSLWSWIHDVSVYIESLWNVLAASLSDFYHWIGEKFEEVVNLIWNSFTLLWADLTAQLWDIVDYLVTPLKDVWNYLTETLAEWFEKIRAAIDSFLSDPMQWVYDLGAEIWEAIKSLGAEIWQAMIETANAVSAWIGEKILAHAPSFTEYLRDVLFWLWEQIKVTYTFVKEEIAPAVWEATSGAVGWLKDQFTHSIGLAYDEMIQHARSYTPITPAKSVTLAGVMFGSAVGFGALAHGISLAVEMIPNLKFMGVHYLSAFAAHMGGFGAISSATMGVIAALALRVPFTYYMNDLLRPTIPDDKLLIEFRAKRELDFPQFKRYMAFHGHSDQWTGKIDSWLWKDPRLFEILYCADVTVPPKEWLVRKFERAGYEDIDIDVLVRVVERRTTRSPRTYYTTALRRNFRHGFISEADLVEGIEALEMAPDAIDWIKRAGELDNVYEVNSDLVTAYRTAYRNDIMTDAETKASLASLGLPPERIEAILYLEWVRKLPSAIKAEEKAIAAEWAEIQAEYSRVYIESYRRGLITREKLTANLIAIGYQKKVAEGTALLEEIKFRPKAKPSEIPTPIIPEPPEPPEYES